MRLVLAKVIDFEIGCRLCANLTQTDKGTYTCAVLDFTDGTQIYPKVNGRWTEDNGACNGESYVRRKPSNRLSRRSV